VKNKLLFGKLLPRVNNAKICPNDDVIYSGAECPLCLSRLGHPLRTWLCPMNPIVGGKHEPTVHHKIPAQPEAVRVAPAGLVVFRRVDPRGGRDVLHIAQAGEQPRSGRCDREEAGAAAPARLGGHLGRKLLASARALLSGRARAHAGPRPDVDAVDAGGAA